MNKFGRKKLALAVIGVLNAGMVASLVAPAAHAQDASPATSTGLPATSPFILAQAAPPVAAGTPVTSTTVPGQPTKIERVEITGSRLPSPTLESTSPVNVISAQDIRWDGITNTANIINQLPSAFADQGNNLSNGATGTASINLRNLGSSRTLVLIDGKRLPAGSPQFWATDVNVIPAPLIERVEVLTGGASAVYGSDAVAGVVNFIMNDHFEGVQVQWNANGYNHQQQDTLQSLKDRNAVNPNGFPVPGDVGLDGQTQNFSMLMGGNFANGKGNATLFFNYRQAQAVTQGTRNFSACALSATKTTLVCGGGSGTNATGYFTTDFGSVFTVADAAGTLKPLTAADKYNFAPPNYFQRRETQYSFNAIAHYDALPNVRVYGEFDFSNSHTNAQIAAGGIFLQDTYSLNASNPLLSQNFKDTFGITPGNPQTLYIGRRNVEGGGRQQDINLEDYRYVLGAKGDLFDNTWNYNFWWQSGTNRLQQTQQNYFSRAKITKALDVVVDPATGQPACASFVDGTDPACVPYDVFHKGGITPAALGYLTTPSFSNGSTSQSVVGLQVDSDLGASYGWRTPWAKNGAAVAFGIERRVERLQFGSDALSQSGDLSGSGGASPAVDGQYTVNEYYMEARLPILEQQPWAYLLSVNGSYRYSTYNQPSNNVNSYGLGAEWAPVRDYKLRGTYQQAVRAPNIIELYTPAGLNLFNMSTDPCGTSGTQPTPTKTLEQCARTGITPDQYGTTGIVSPTGQYQFQQGGNPNLKPEKSNSWTLGLVATPLPTLSGTVDYWNIKLSDAIGVVPQPLILQNCLIAGVFCDQIHRDDTGSLWINGFIGGITTNTGKLDTDGIDVTVNWNQPIQDWGSVGVSLVGTYVNSYKFSIGAITAECAGFFGTICGNPIPAWRSKLRTTWNTPWYNTSLALTWRFFDSVKLDSSSSNPALQQGYLPPDSKLPTQNYIDLAASWNIDKNFTVYAGCNNLFDKDPPVLSSAIAGPPFGNGNTYPQVYDTLGRNLFIQITAKF